jgi:hypothetical protein
MPMNSGVRLPVHLAQLDRHELHLSEHHGIEGRSRIVKRQEELPVVFLHHGLEL